MIRINNNIRKINLLCHTRSQNIRYSICESQKKAPFSFPDAVLKLPIIICAYGRCAVFSNSLISRQEQTDIVCSSDVTVEDAVKTANKMGKVTAELKDDSKITADLTTSD